MIHWASRYIGRPWDASENHCWAFCCLVWQECFGWDVAPAPVGADDPRALRRALAGDVEHHAWIPVDAAREGDGVLMATGAHPCHVGIWIDPADGMPGVLHSIKGGSVFTPASRLADIGYRRIGTYRRVI